MPYPSHSCSPPLSGVRHKRQRLQVEIKAIYWNLLWDKKTNASNNNIDKNKQKEDDLQAKIAHRLGQWAQDGQTLQLGWVLPRRSICCLLPWKRDLERESPFCPLPSHGIRCYGTAPDSATHGYCRNLALSLQETRRESKYLCALWSTLNCSW